MVTQRSCINGDAHTREASVEMATLNEYRSKFRLLSKHEVITERKKLFETINGDAFFPLKAWPKEYQRLFWAKPIGDKDTFKLMLFCLGNGCAPQLITDWIILSQGWLPSKAEKRARRLDFILNNVDVKRNIDLDYDKWLYLNRRPLSKICSSVTREGMWQARSCIQEKQKNKKQQQKKKL